MPLLTLSRARLAFGHHALLDGAELVLEPRERVGLIGRNGSGKSSLLKVLSGQAQLDDGERGAAPQATIAHVPQETELDGNERMFDAFAVLLGAAARLPCAYQHAPATVAG